MSEEKEKKKGKSKSTYAILIAAVVVIIALVGVIIFLLKPKENATGSLVVDASNLEQIKEKINSKEAEGMFEVNMNTIWHFADGSSPSTDAYLANGAANRLPISFEVLLNDEVIYTSTVIPLGNKIKEIVLEKDLDAGTYAAICRYTLWNEDATQDSSFDVNIQLVIEN